MGSALDAQTRDKLEGSKAPAATASLVDLQSVGTASAVRATLALALEGGSLTKEIQQQESSKTLCLVAGAAAEAPSSISGGSISPAQRDEIIACTPTKEDLGDFSRWCAYILSLIVGVRLGDGAAQVIHSRSSYSPIQSQGQGQGQRQRQGQRQGQELTLESGSCAKEPEHQSNVQLHAFCLAV